jgi:hypothetical protein
MAKKVKAGARIRTVDLLITKRIKAKVEDPDSST